MTYNVRFTNQSESPANIPDPDKGPDGAVWKAMLWAQSQRADGSWRYIINPGNLMWKGDTQFAPCKMLQPKETVEFKSLSGGFFIPRGELTGMGPKLTVRAYLGLVCIPQRGALLEDGTLPTAGMETGPFSVSMPAGR